MLKSVRQEDQTFAHGVGTSSAGCGRLYGNFFDENAFVVDMHEGDLWLRIVAAKHLVVVDHQAVRDVLAVEACALVALHYDWDVVFMGLLVVDNEILLIFFDSAFDHEWTQLLADS